MEKYQFDDLARVAAAHAVEVALGYVSHPDAVLEIAQHHFKQILGHDEDWPERRVLH